MSHKLERLQEKYEKAISNLELGTIQEIISELNAISNSEKEEFLSFYIKIGSDLFEASVNLNNYNSDDFQQKISDWHNRSTIIKEVKTKKEEFRDDFNDTLIRFYKNCNDIFINLKGHFLFLFDNNISRGTKIIILTDDTFENHPLLTRIKEKNKEFEVDKYKILDFIDSCKKFPTKLEEKYLCLMLISPDLNSEWELMDELKILFGLFNKSYIINKKNDAINSIDDFILKTIDDDIHDYIEIICNKVFNNVDITYDEEIIVKKFFGKNTPIIDYKILKSGNSGSKVIEVQPIKELSPRTSRFVIKYSKKDIHRKIKKEADAFINYIEDFQMRDYGHQYIETDQYEAIKYKYASSDGRTQSYPFASLIKDSLREIPLLNYNLIDVLKELFLCEPFEFWNNPKIINKSIWNMYSNYLIEEKIIKAIALIDGIDKDDVLSCELWKNYTEIKKMQIDYKEKVCHGDLHTENFFKDDVGVYLIDFGYTDHRHSILDHTTLEASIKFKHIPQYIDIIELMEIEKILCTNKKFENIDLSTIKRANLKSLIELIVFIRKESSALFYKEDNNLEYFLSLFIITLRQIQYPDLNQRYAYESAKFLAKYIVDFSR